MGKSRDAAAWVSTYWINLNKPLFLTKLNHVCIIILENTSIKCPVWNEANSSCGFQDHNFNFISLLLKYFLSQCRSQDRKKYLDNIHSYMEVHGTVHGTSTVHLPSYVKNHGILSGRDLQFLLRETKVSPADCKLSRMKINLYPAGK